MAERVYAAVPLKRNGCYSDMIKGTESASLEPNVRRTTVVKCSIQGKVR